MASHAFEGFQQITHPGFENVRQFQSLQFEAWCHDVPDHQILHFSTIFGQYLHGLGAIEIIHGDQAHNLVVLIGDKQHLYATGNHAFTRLLQAGAGVDADGCHLSKVCHDLDCRIFQANPCFE